MTSGIGTKRTLATLLKLDVYCSQAESKVLWSLFP